MIQSPDSTAFTILSGLEQSARMRAMLFAFWLRRYSFSGQRFLGTLDIVSMATGEVVPASQVKTVQHLEGGIVSFIHVKEGTLFNWVSHWWFWNLRLRTLMWASFRSVLHLSGSK